MFEDTVRIRSISDSAEMFRVYILKQLFTSGSINN